MSSLAVIVTIGEKTPLELRLTAVGVATQILQRKLEKTLVTFPPKDLLEARVGPTVPAAPAGHPPFPPSAGAAGKGGATSESERARELAAALALRLASEPTVKALLAAYPQALKLFFDVKQLPSEPSCWIVTRDCFGLYCYIFGWVTVLLVDYVTQTKVLWPWFEGSAVGLAHGLVFQTSCVFILWAYLRAATTDPGTVSKGTANEEDTVPPPDDKERTWKRTRTYCKKCKCIKPPRAHHCSTCQRCIDKMGAFASPSPHPTPPHPDFARTRTPQMRSKATPLPSHARCKHAPQCGPPPAPPPPLPPLFPSPQTTTALG